jgi:hypothetical protein
MTIPRASEAIVDIIKLRDYCLSRTHPRGRHKARVFFATFGITEANAEKLQAALKAAVNANEGTPGITDRFGSRYAVDFKWDYEGRSASIRSAWIVPSDNSEPRFITCFVL